MLMFSIELPCNNNPLLTKDTMQRVLAPEVQKHQWNLHQGFSEATSAPQPTQNISAMC
jgi:hypothetical protein